MPKETLETEPPAAKKFAAYIIALGVLATIAALVSTDFHGQFDLVVLVALAALAIDLVKTGELLPRGLWGMSLSEPVHLATIAIFGFGFAVTTGVASRMAAEIVSRRGWRKALYNLAVYAVTITASGLTYRTVSAVSSGRFALVGAFSAAALAYRLVDWMIDSRLSALTSDSKSFTRSLADNAGKDLVLFIALALIGFSAVLLYRVQPGYSLTMIAPLMALSVGYGRARRYYSEFCDMSTEVARAGEVQRRLMPVKEIERNDLELACKYTPYAEIGGDFFDVFELGSDIWITIGDVMGKGIPAALVAAEQHSYLRFLASRFDTAEMLTYTNSLACSGSLADAFVTMICSRFHPDKGVFFWSNAGHPPPILFRKRTGACHLLQTGDIALGIEAGAEYEEESLFMGEGDVLVLYTDGATDFHGARKRHHEIERLQVLVANNARENAVRIVEVISDAVELVTGGRVQDDMTLIVLKRKTGRRASGGG